MRLGAACALVGALAQSPAPVQAQAWPVVLLDADTALDVWPSLDVDDDLAAVWLMIRGGGLAALTTTHGNAPAWATCRNSRRLAAALGALAPPMACGGGGYLWGGFAQQRDEAPGEAARLLVERTLAAEQPVVWVAVGALTNVAAALHARPELVSRISSLVIMGGSLQGLPELNFLADGEATRFVLGLAGLRRVLLPLDLGKQVSVETAHLDRLARCIEAAEAAGGSARWVAPHMALLYRHAVYFGLLNPLLFGADPHGPSIAERLAAGWRGQGQFHPWDVLASAFVTDRHLFGALSCWRVDLPKRRLVASRCDPAEVGPCAAEPAGAACLSAAPPGVVMVPDSVDGAALVELLLDTLCAVPAAAP